MIIKIADLIIKKNLLINKTTLSIADKGLTVIVGDNGSGKTLLLKKIFEILIDKNYKVCFVEQSNEICFRKCSVLENIAMSFDKNKIEQARELLKKYDLEHLSEHKINELSGGEKRMICILRCFFNEADILLIDEPTNDLDYVLVGKIRMALADYMDNHKIIAISHDDRIISMTDSVISINDKKLSCKTYNEFKNDIIIDNDSNEESNKADEKECNNFLKRCLTGNWIKVLFYVFFACLFLYLYLDYVRVDDKIPEDNYPENCVVVFSELSPNNWSVFQNSIPITMLKLFDEDMSMSKKVNLYDEILEQSNSASVYYDIDIKDSEKYIVYPIDYYDFANNAGINSLEVYSEKNSFEECIGLYELTDTIFSGTLHKKNEVKQFLDEYRKKNINENSQKCSLVIIDLVNMPFSDFIISNDIKELSEYGFRITSKETVQLINQIMEFALIKNIFVLAIVIGIGLIIISCIIWFILMYMNADSILLYRNSGVCYRNIIKLCNEKYGDIIFNVIYIIVILLVCFGVVYNVHGTEKFALYVPPIIYVAAFVIAERIKRFMIRVRIKKICSWRYR